MSEGGTAEVARRERVVVVVGCLKLISLYQSSWGADVASMEGFRRNGKSDSDGREKEVGD